VTTDQTCATGCLLRPLLTKTQTLAKRAHKFVQIEPLTTFLPAAARLVAIGDLHGDMGKTRRAFRIGGLIDDQDRWSGGTTTAVQVLLLHSAGLKLAAGVT